MATGLTDIKLKALKSPVEGRVEYPDHKVPGLRVRVNSAGAKTFILRKRQGAKLHNVTLGRYDEERFGLTEARKKARLLLSDLESGKGVPPAITQSAAGKMQTFRMLLPVYLASKSNLRSLSEIKRILERFVFPYFADRAVDTITRAEVTALIDRLAAKTPAMARSVHAQLSAFFTWAMPRLEHLQGNPCKDAGRPEKSVARDRVLSDPELVVIWQAAPFLPSAFHYFYKLLMITAQRRNEVAGMDWSELDRANALWTIPRERAKNSVANLVPLSPLAVSILDIVAGDEEWPIAGVVLTTDGHNPISGFSKSKRLLDTAIVAQSGSDLTGEKPAAVAHWRVHDLRRTVATGFQRLGVRFEVTEAVLNHVSGARGGVAGVYQRHDWKAEKRSALYGWAEHLRSLVAEAK